jgi:hypothetical protein
MKYTHIAAFYVLLLVSISTIAQEKSTTDSPLPKLVLKVMPLHLIAKYPTLQGAIEYRFSDHWAFQAQVGYGNFSYHRNRSVVQLRPQVRYYVSPCQVNHKRVYLAFEPFFTRAMKRDWAEFYNNTTVLDAEERTAAGTLIYTGLQVPLTNRWLLEAYIGAGFQYIEHIQLKRTDVYYAPYNNTREEYEMTGIVGFNIAYSLWNRLPK